MMMWCDTAFNATGLVYVIEIAFMPEDLLNLENTLYTFEEGNDTLAPGQGCYHTS